MMKLVNSYYHWKIELIGYALGEIKMSQPQNVHFKKISPKVKNQNSKFLSTFYNFALKIENCWAERVVKSFWKPEMPILLCTFGLFILG